MKKILLSIVVVFAAMTAQAQYYYLPFVSAGHNPGSINSDAEYPVGGGLPAGWTTISLATNASPVWSANQSIPFSFSFNGSPETQYKVSSSGILTFDVATGVAAPTYTRAALPSALIPDKSVCLWGLASLGTNDYIVTKTFGSAPNRQHWIQFSSYGYGATASDGSNFTYWSIVLEETSNKIYLVDNRTGGFTGTNQVSAGIQINSGSAYSVAGSPNLASTATTDATPADNTYYQFTQGVQPANSILFASVTPSAGSVPSYGLTGAVITIGGTITNLGSAAITSFDVRYTDGTTTWSDTKSCNVTAGNSYTFTHNTTYSIPNPNGHPLTCWVELAGDIDHTDDTLATVITGAVFLPTHTVVIEEGTGTWCGWCPRGAVYMDSIRNVHPNDVNLVAVHNADPMTVTVYDAGVSAAISGYPSCLVDRKEVMDPSAIFAGFAAHQNDFGMADISVTPTINGNNLSVVTATHAAVDIAGNYRLALVVTEDDVTGTGTTWDQHNYYSFQTNNLPLVGAGHDWQAEPNPVLAADMHYDHVARSISGSYLGQANSLTLPLTAGNTSNYTFNAALDPTWEHNQLIIIVMLINGTTGEVMNSASHSFVNGMSTTPLVSGEVNVFPTLVTDKTFVTMNLESYKGATINVTDMTGRLVSSDDLSHYYSGSQQYILPTSNLNAGMYMVSIVTPNGTISNKIVKN